MNIEELSEAVYEDLNGRIVSADHQDDRVTLVYECDYWEDPDKRVSFLLRCSEVAETTACPGVSGDLWWTSEHPLLLNHNHQHGSLFFTSKPANLHGVVGVLYQTHEDLFQGWRPLRDHINHCGKTHEILASGNGLLARGPIPLLELYQKSVQRLIKTNIVNSYTPDGGCRAIIFEDSFVICKEVEVSQQTG
jgi:hypothetical protein